jgi:hypothetical protein
MNATPEIDDLIRQHEEDEGCQCHLPSRIEGTCVGCDLPGQTLAWSDEKGQALCARCHNR